MADVLIALAQAERELQQVRSAARMTRRDAEQGWRVARAPDANLRLMLAELTAAHERLIDDHNRLRAKLAALVALTEGD